MGTFAMSQAQRIWTRAVGASVPYSAGGKHDARDWQEREEHQNANELAAQAVATTLVGRRLRPYELRYAAPALHYSFGSAVGAVYGAAIGHSASNDVGRQSAVLSGTALGVALWLTADEIAMPLLGPSRPTDRTRAPTGRGAQRTREARSDRRRERIQGVVYR